MIRVSTAQGVDIWPESPRHPQFIKEYDLEIFAMYML